MIATLLTFIGVTFSSLFSDSLRTETIDGKNYIIHQVEKKETLFSIGKRYGVEIGQVVQSNPGADSGIDAGQILKIPYTPKASGEFYHQVEVGHEVVGEEEFYRDRRD